MEETVEWKSYSYGAGYRAAYANKKFIAETSPSWQAGYIMGVVARIQVEKTLAELAEEIDRRIDRREINKR